jgi:tRNA modification GTPase
VLAGPPNSGKSTLFNALVESEAAITAPVAGTTRDVLTQTVAIGGAPFRFADTAGLRDEAGDPIEAIGVERARAAIADADLVLWLGPEGSGPDSAWEVEPQIDRPGHEIKQRPRHRVSAVTDEGMDAFRRDLLSFARMALPSPGAAALNQRQHALLKNAFAALTESVVQVNPLLAAENLRVARREFDTLLGRTTTEDMLDALFGRFCIGK